MATHSSILAWRIPTDRGAWQVTVHWLQRVRQGSATNTKVFPNFLTPHTLRIVLPLPILHPPHLPVPHPQPPCFPALTSPWDLLQPLSTQSLGSRVEGYLWRKGPLCEGTMFLLPAQDPDKHRASSHPRVTKSSSDPRASGLSLISTLKLLCPFPLSRSVPPTAGLYGAF